MIYIELFKIKIDFFEKFINDNEKIIEIKMVKYNKKR